MSHQLSILAQIQQIRDRVNVSWKHHQLRQNYRLFSQLCSSMDVLEDSASAIHAFETKSFPDATSALYLIVYGLLQALFLQQDAAFHLAEALGSRVNLSDWPELTEVRDVRNTAVGHPTRRDRRRPISFHHITQMTLSRTGFEMLSYSESGEFEHRYVDLHQLIAQQGKAISRILSGLITQLRHDEIKHKELFRMEKLAQLFPPMTSYYLEKIAESLRPGEEPRIGLFGLDGIESTLNEFRDAVGRRDMEYYEALEHEYALIDYAIANLRSFIDARVKGVEPSLSPLAAEIYLAYLSAETDRLRRNAREIDEDYEC